MGCGSSNLEQSVVDEALRSSRIRMHGKDKIADTPTTNLETAATGESQQDATEIQNPYMPALTPKDTFHLKMSWKGIRRSLEVTGVTMFTKYFNLSLYILLSLYSK